MHLTCCNNLCIEIKENKATSFLLFVQIYIMYNIHNVHIIIFFYMMTILALRALQVHFLSTDGL